MDSELLPCDVCVLLRGDRTPKETRYCSMCDSNICDQCRVKWTWRAVAALKVALGAKKGGE